MGIRKPWSLLFMLAAQSMQSVAIAGVSLFLPIIREDIEMSIAQAGLLGTVATVSYGLSQLPSGVVVSRLGPRHVFTFGLLAANLLTASLFVVDSFAVLVAVQVALGPARALVFSSGMAIVETHFAASHRATSMSVFVMGSMSTNVLLGLVGPWLATEIGWRATFLLIAGLGAATTVTYAVGFPTDAVRTAARSPGWGGFGEVWRSLVVRLCLILHATRLGVASALGFWLPTILVEAKGLSLGAAGVVVGTCVLLGGPGNVAGGLIADRTGRPVAVVGISSAVVGVSLVGLALSTSVPVIVACALVQAVAVQAGFGPLFAMSAQAVPPELAVLSTSLGALTAVLGGAVGTYTLGATGSVDESFALGVLFLAALATLGVLVAVWLKRAMSRAMAGAGPGSGSTTGSGSSDLATPVGA